ncbi:histidine kinase [Novosphingobium sp. SL115]|uniref:sensor histidine kinase n=1 Tax=Novosphingobium sp. SL115 TaxID=2995150 RepID=UPI0022745E1D|nr:histidine kinase dimerization/phospho-acceptor domain-containing protein [Novosphingobium sp. SL115]MCY1672410.1 histidine kinase [Novosphingobium sp. SL115]
MIVDDRLETVLRTTVAGKTAARTQLRQIVDLLGTVPLADWNQRHAAALERADLLASTLSDDECAAILRAVPHRSAVLAYHFGNGSPRVASASIAAANLSEEDWLALIPRLPVRARGFVRHRNNLTEKVRELLSRLGVDDFLLSAPPVGNANDTALDLAGAADIEIVQPAPQTPAAVAKQPAPAQPPAQPIFAAQAENEEGIGAIVRRIEAFRRRRDEREAGTAKAIDAPSNAAWAGVAPLLPFVDDHGNPPALPAFIDVRTDAHGIVTQASIEPVGMLAGSRLFNANPASPVHCDPGTASAFRMHQPIRGGQIRIEGAPGVAGDWQVDGTPGFARDGGRFTGYLLRLRRIQAVVQPDRTALASAGEADRLRQLLHELRTPINAIQGFAEVIQQQVFGATPHQYRAMAASIASDAAQMLAGFEEIERLVKLESRMLSLDPGEADFGGVVARLVEQVSPVFAARNVRLTVSLNGRDMIVNFAPEEVERAVWRALSVITASVAPGERLAIELAATLCDNVRTASLAITLPAALQKLDDAALFAPDAGGTSGLTASSMLGNGFALRLARAEFMAGGGVLRREGARLRIDLPCKTDDSHTDDDHTVAPVASSAAAG